jgi:hypothetical protein
MYFFQKNEEKYPLYGFTMSKKNNFIPTPTYDIKSLDPNQLAAQLLQVGVRSDLKNFFGLCRKDYAERIDFTQPVTFLDDELPFYLPKMTVDKKKSFVLFVQLTFKTGETGYLLVHTTVHNQAQIAVGIAEVPENVVLGFRAFFARSN